MLSKLISIYKKKSLKERFLFIMGFVLFLVYLGLGFAVIFIKSLPLNLSYNYRLAFGILLIGYSFTRFLRFFSNSDS